MIIAPSILNANLDNIDSLLEEFIDSGIKYLHLDIMDGKFVPNTTLGVELQKMINKYDFVFDTHLMVEHPEAMYRDFYKAGSNIITFHYEAVKDPAKLIRKIHSLGAKAGISIKPNTDVSVLKPYLHMLDQILIMSVEPGFGGQKFMDSALDKVEYLDNLRCECLDYDYLIEVDGGINIDNAYKLYKVGCDIVVMGTAFLNTSDKKDLVNKVSLFK